MLYCLQDFFGRIENLTQNLPGTPHLGGIFEIFCGHQDTQVQKIEEFLRFLFWWWQARKLVNWATKKNRWYVPLYWLFSRDPYSGLVKSLNSWAVSSPEEPQTTSFFFIAQFALFKIGLEADRPVWISSPEETESLGCLLISKDSH